MPKFNHAFDLAFEIITDDSEGEAFTFDDFERALLDRIARLKNSSNPNEYREAIGAPFDTFQIEE